MSDYLKGTVTKSLDGALRRIEDGRDRPLLIDPKIPHLEFYAGATLVTPNHHEAEIATHRRIRTDDEAHGAPRAISKSRAQCDARADHARRTRDVAVGGRDGRRGAGAAREVADVTGAGDTVVATLALALAAGATMSEAAVLANHRGGDRRRKVRARDSDAR